MHLPSLGVQHLTSKQSNIPPIIIVMACVPFLAEMIHQQTKLLSLFALRTISSNPKTFGTEDGDRSGTLLSPIMELVLPKSKEF
jgi:hypothetical protein